MIARLERCLKQVSRQVFPSHVTNRTFGTTGCNELLRHRDNPTIGAPARPCNRV